MRVEFSGELKRIRTMADGTADVTINVPEYCLEEVQKMLMWIGDYIKWTGEVVREKDE